MQNDARQSKVKQDKLKEKGGGGGKGGKYVKTKNT
jgi:hypothetical protein